MSKCPSLYTKDTAVEFHYLLVTVLAGYKAGLEVLGTQCDMGHGGRTPYQPEDYDLTWMFTFLLWRIAHSSILRSHLTFLHAAELLILDDALRGGDRFDLETDNVEIETAGGGPEITDQEMSVIQFHAMSTGKHQQPAGVVFLRWIHLLVSDLTALEILSLFFSHGTPSHMKVHVHAVALPPPLPDKALWKPVIERALHSQAPLLLRRYDEIIATLVDYIKQGKENTDTFMFYHHFTEQVMAVTGSVHCEAALACLVKHSTTAVPVRGMEFQRDVWLFPFVIYDPSPGSTGSQHWYPWRSRHLEALLSCVLASVSTHGSPHWKIWSSRPSSQDDSCPVAPMDSRDRRPGYA
jgi:hypothetical protein